MPRLRLAQAHLLIGRCKVELRIQAHGGFFHPWPYTMECGRLEDRGVQDPFMHQALHLVQQRLACAAVAFDGLLLEERSGRPIKTL